MIVKETVFVRDEFNVRRQKYVAGQEVSQEVYDLIEKSNGELADAKGVNVFATPVVVEPVAEKVVEEKPKEVAKEPEAKKEAPKKSEK